MIQEPISRTPVHVSIIMDGNGRWARERGLDRAQGHLKGTQTVRAITEESVAAGVKYLSLYTFSEENWGRPEKEVRYLMELFFKSIGEELDTMMQNGIRLLVLGNRERLSGELNDIIDDTMKLTAGNDKMTLILFLSYSGKWDILQAAKTLALKTAESGDARSYLDKIDEDAFSSMLVTSGIPDPDLIIRTSGEERISNYLLWQGAYSEFYFTKTLWPDFGREQFREALAAFAARDRRYGKVK